MGGLNTFLNAGMKDLDKIEKTKSEKPVGKKEPEKKKDESSEKTNMPKVEESVSEQISEPAPKEEVKKKKTVQNTQKKASKVGRPTFESLGKEARKQYTLTLPVSKYEEIMKRAEASSLSFAKITEIALTEYLNNHK